MSDRCLQDTRPILENCSFSLLIDIARMSKVMQQLIPFACKHRNKLILTHKCNRVISSHLLSLSNYWPIFRVLIGLIATCKYSACSCMKHSCFMIINWNQFVRLISQGSCLTFICKGVCTLKNNFFICLSNVVLQMMASFGKKLAKSLL